MIHINVETMTEFIHDNQPVTLPLVMARFELPTEVVAREALALLVSLGMVSECSGYWTAREKAGP